MWYKYTIFFPFKSSKLYVLAQNISWKFVNLFRLNSFIIFPPCPDRNPCMKKPRSAGVFVLFGGAFFTFACS